MQVPTPLVMPSVIRIYFAARGMDGRSFPAFVDVSRSNPLQVLAVHDAPILTYGPPGTFDDDGIMPACAILVGSDVWLYYSGWNRRRNIPYHNTTGIAIARDGLVFSRMFNGPILERTHLEPYMAVTPWVIRDADRWRMWYVSGTKWKLVDQKYEPVYAIKYAESEDGIVWHRNNILAIPQEHDDEACAHPTVVLRDNRYHMWFCYRDSHDFRDGQGSYRIGYAQSHDALTWHRLDSLSGIAPSSTGWDSTMLCYPSVVELGDNLLMFYNGNGFGSSGIGCALWEGPLP
ncbi:MAG: glycoside hydrolase family protein [Acidiferrobacteraceae bacterium]